MKNNIIYIAAISCCIIAWASVLCHLRAQVKEDLRLAVPTEAKGAWLEYEQTLRGHSVRLRQDFTHRDNGKIVLSGIDDHIVRSSQAGIIHEATSDYAKSVARDPDNKNWKLDVVNSTYQFSGQRSAGLSHWSFTGLVTPAVFRSQSTDSLRTRDMIEGDYLLAPVAWESVLLRRLVDHSCFQLIHAGTLKKDGQAFFEIRFTIDKTKKIGSMRNLETGRLLLDPKRSWVVIESESACRNGRGGLSLERITHQYRQQNEVMPLPTESNTELITDDKSYAVSGRTTYEWLGPTTLKEEDFTLKAYGFPDELKESGVIGFDASAPALAQSTEVQVAESSQNRWQLPALIAAFVVLVIGLVLRALLTRRAQATN